MQIFRFVVVLLCLFVASYIYAGDNILDDMYISSGGKISSVKVNGAKIKYYTFDEAYKDISDVKELKRNFTISVKGVTGHEGVLDNLLTKVPNVTYLKHVNAISIDVEESKLSEILRIILSKFAVNYIQKTPYKTIEAEKVTYDKAIQPNEAEIYSPNDPLFSNQWYLYNQQNPNLDLGFLSYRKFIRENNYRSPFDNPPVAAVLDVGIYYNSEELKDRIYINKGEIPNNNIDDDNNGYKDDYMGVDVGHSECTLSQCIDDYKVHHGTMMASIMGAKTDNSYYMSGVLPDEVKILPVSASYDYTQVDRYNEGYEYILEMKDRGVNIISVNVSAGGPFDVTEYNLLKQFYNAGILIVAAVGNDNMNIDTNRGFGTSDRTRAYPAKYNLDNIIAVGALDEKGNVATFSNYGNTVDIYMPGVNIVGLNYPATPGYAAVGSGTSQAAAITSGLVGVAAYLYPECNPVELRSLILEKATEEIGAFQVTSRIGLFQVPSRQTYTMRSAKVSSVNGAGLISDGRLQNFPCGGTYGIGK